MWLAMGEVNASWLANKRATTSQLQFRLCVRACQPERLHGSTPSPPHRCIEPAAPVAKLCCSLRTRSPIPAGGETSRVQSTIATGERDVRRTEDLLPVKVPRGACTRTCVEKRVRVPSRRPTNGTSYVRGVGRQAPLGTFTLTAFLRAGTNMALASQPTYSTNGGFRCPT